MVFCVACDNAQLFVLTVMHSIDGCISMSILLFEFDFLKKILSSSGRIQEIGVTLIPEVSGFLIPFSFKYIVFNFYRSSIETRISFLI